MKSKFKKIVIYFCLLTTLIVLPLYANAQQCPESTIITVVTNKISTFKITLSAHAGNTWTYYIEELTGKDISHADIIGIDSCLDNVVSTVPSASAIGEDGSTGFYGIKWDVSDSFSSGYFSITLDDDYPMATVEALIKSGNSFGTGLICGPACKPATFAEEIIFRQKPGNNKIKLTWTAISEIDVLGYNIYRAEGLSGDFEKVNSNLISAKGSPATTVGYLFVDTNVNNGKQYTYRLEEIQSNGESRSHAPVSATPRFFYGLFNFK